MRPDGGEDSDRRAFLARTAALGLGLAFAGTVAGCGTADTAAPVVASRPLPDPKPQVAKRATPPRATRRLPSDPGIRGGTGGYGELIEDAWERLALPAGFSYEVVAEEGVTDLDVGGKTPGRHDGSASFPSPGGGIVLVNNHEVAPGMSGDPLPVPTLPLLTYDPGCPGGTTNVVLSADGQRLREYVSLAGTDHNCAGGPTPWNTWLTCEETESRKGQDGRKEDHGYVFEVDPMLPLANLNPRPIKALGRFKHEAVAVDPGRGHVYLTEDAKSPNGLFYRFTPPSPSRPLRRDALRKLPPDAGVLAAMQVLDKRGKAIPDLSVVRKVGASYRVAWVPVPDRDAQKVPTRKQFSTGARRKLGDLPKMPITRARKLEGAWWSAGGAFFVSSYAVDRDGAAHAGQVWFLDPRLGTVTLVLYYAPGRSRDSRVDGPDNIAGSPYGGVIIAEDGGGRQHLLGATATGETFSIARNLARQAGVYSEFTGPNFSPDRRTLFANIQVPGVVFAIRGPWKAVD